VGVGAIVATGAGVGVNTGIVAAPPAGAGVAVDAGRRVAGGAGRSCSTGLVDNSSHEKVQPVIRIVATISRIIRKRCIVFRCINSFQPIAAQQYDTISATLVP
jgi:hypothetical protein